MIDYVAKHERCGFSACSNRGIQEVVCIHGIDCYYHRDMPRFPICITHSRKILEGEVWGYRIVARHEP